MIAGIIAVLGIGFISGYNWCNSGKQGAVLDSLDDDKKKVEKIREKIVYRNKEVKIYVDKIKTVKDSTGCADSIADPVISDSLLQTYRLTAGSPTDWGLPFCGLPGSGNSADALNSPG